MFRIAWKNAWFNKFHSVLSLLLFALGVGLISFLLQVQHRLQQNFEKNLAGVDLIIGAKGSPLQLILCNLYHIDNPTGNIKLSAVQAFMNPAHPLISAAVPVSVGDNYRGFRIVGTTQEFPGLYSAGLEQGTMFGKAMEACIGYEVSKNAGLKIGDEFYSEHGLLQGDGENSHGQKFRVCGIFSPGGAVLDQLILTPIESIWMVHSDHKEEHENSEKSITALLLKYRNRANFQVLNLPRNINEHTDMQAAVPAIEMNRLYVILGTGEKMLRMLAFSIILVSGVGSFLALLNALKERKNELALMRVMGASSGRLFGLIMAEAGILALVGSIVGFAISHGAMFLFGNYVKNAYRYSFEGLTFLPGELVLFAVAVLIGLVSGLIPALLAYRTRITVSSGQN